MRDFIFRVWDKQKKKMYINTPCIFQDRVLEAILVTTPGTSPSGICGQTITTHRFENSWEDKEGRLIPMQYIGKEDAKGIPICEGDVIDGLGYITYEPTSASFVIYSEAEEECYTLGDDQLEVIGNIYENPELKESCTKGDD